jgi:hypothetical protein
MLLSLGVAVLAFTFVVSALTLTCFITTRPPAWNIAPSPRVPFVPPVTAGLLVNRPRRAIAASVIELIHSGAIAVDQDNGPTRYRLHVARGLVPDAQYYAVSGLFVDEDGAQRGTIDLSARNHTRRQQLRGALTDCARWLARSGLLRISWLRKGMDRLIWLALCGDAVLLGIGVTEGRWEPSAVGVVGVGTTVGMMFLRRRIGWWRSGRGDEIAREVLGFRGYLLVDSEARRRYPQWTVLFDLEVLPIKLPDGQEVDAAWVSGLVVMLDPGSDPDLSALEGTGDAGG